MESSQEPSAFLFRLFRVFAGIGWQVGAKFMAYGLFSRGGHRACAGAHQRE